MRDGRQMRRRKRRKFGTAVILAVMMLFLVIILATHNKNQKDPKFIDPETQSTYSMQQPTESESETEETWSFEAHETDATTTFPDTVVSKSGILIDVAKGEIIAEKGAHERIVPASMTKILTVLVAAEHISEEQLDEEIAIPFEATNYSFAHDCSNTGYEVDEKVKVRDLFYGTILPSGADSALTLANYVAGSHEAFVDLMNEKLEEMGLSETTHVTNCVGLYDENHYSTPYDMAVILKAASDNAWCREVLSAHIYTTTKTAQHPDGIIISNWFLRRIEDKETNGEVLCAKTGYVSQSGSCAASLALDKDGREYLCVTAGSTSSWRCIYDHVDTYKTFLPETEAEEDPS